MNDIHISLLIGAGIALVGIVFGAGTVLVSIRLATDDKPDDYKGPS
jgi:hypothetical protein